MLFLDFVKKTLSTRRERLGKILHSGCEEGFRRQLERYDKVAQIFNYRFTFPAVLISREHCQLRRSVVVNWRVAIEGEGLLS